MPGIAMRIMIVDDEPLARERLARLCGQVDGARVVGFAADGSSVLPGLDELMPDVILLDISMPGLDGLALARVLRRQQQRPAVIFVTAHGHHALAAFEVAATDYLLKPVSPDRLRQALDRVAATPAPEPAYLREIWAPHGREMVRLAVETLDLIEAERDYVRLHCRGRAYLVRGTIRDLESRLDPGLFVRAHRSAIVPIDRIHSLHRGQGGGWTVLLSVGRIVRVGRSFEQKVRAVTTGGPETRRHRMPMPNEVPFATSAPPKGPGIAALPGIASGCPVGTCHPRAAGITPAGDKRGHGSSARMDACTE